MSLSLYAFLHTNLTRAFKKGWNLEGHYVSLAAEVVELYIYEVYK